MVTLLITSLVILAVLAVAAFFFRENKAPATDSNLLRPAPELRSLFADAGAAELEAQQKLALELRREETLSRARQGTHSALQEAAATGDADFYNQVLNDLLARAHGPRLLSLTSYITRHELSVNSELAEKCIEMWAATPTTNSVAQMLHVAALSNDATTYGNAIEVALQCRGNGRLTNVSDEMLSALISGEYWVLSAQARASGAGFVLKQTLANARRELEAAREQ
jgi:hypothetical protein